MFRGYHAMVVKRMSGKSAKNIQYPLIFIFPNYIYTGCFLVTPASIVVEVLIYPQFDFKKLVQT